MGDRGERFCYAGKGSPRGELSPVRVTERGLLFLRLIVITPLRLDKLGTRPRAPSLALRAIHLVSPRRGYLLPNFYHHDTKEQSPMEKSLQLVFKNAAGSSKIITISNPKENLTKAETDAAMQKIVAANVFNTIGGDLVQAVEARVVNRNVQVLA